MPAQSVLVWLFVGAVSNLVAKVKEINTGCMQLQTYLLFKKQTLNATLPKFFYYQPVNDPRFGTVLLFVCERVCAPHTVHSPHLSLPLDLSQLLDSLVYSSLSKLDCS